MEIQKIRLGLAKDLPESEQRQWRDFATEVMNFLSRYNVGNFWTSRGTIGLSRSASLHGFMQLFGYLFS